MPQDLKKELKDKDKIIRNQEATITESNSNQEKLTLELAESKKLIRELEQTITELHEEYAQTKNNLRKSGANAKAILNKELVEKVDEAVKTIIFRTWKFIQDEEDLEDATEACIPYLKVSLPIPKDEFIKDYGVAVNDAIKGCRQVVQAEGKKRVQGMLFV